MQKSNDLELVVVGAYPDEIIANLAKSALDAAGIETAIRNHNVPAYPAGMGFDLIVRADDAKRARKILSKSRLA